VRLLPDLDKTPQSYEEAKGIVAKVADAVRGILDSVEETVDIETLIPLRQRRRRRMKPQSFNWAL
jgi:hypothetical protein